ncbi:ATP phosphoribosyltransferase [Phormidium sp. FACHB-1136]|jgi:ATP phosphoribosyltransferase|uniref:ATP phosphoribosyltransferase n=1 Tax=Phormidium sp. FACHB-1136 TaxID=2692848 RepID=UPI001688D3E8|nr:ATP phosphoribosyltransferase [Phormidium sp. FACHB-1136]MBD2426778.1 ATP phosphoribosyltransferase [Phormidium sp. FACHB-1136]
MLTIALPKGALLGDSIQLFQRVGLDFSLFQDKANRQLQILDPTGRARALLVRAQDVPVYVEYGQAQIGIVGYDVLREKQPKVANLADLGFGGCRLSVAVKADSPYRSALDIPAHSRIASKFVHCAQDYFQSLDLPVDIVPLSGSVELGPITGMSEAIVDLVSTGKTLRENNLIELEVLYYSTARLIVHPLSYRVNPYGLGDWITQLRQQATAGAAQSS